MQPAAVLEVGEDDVAPGVELQHQVARRVAHAEGEAHHAVRAELTKQHNMCIRVCIY